MLYPERPACRRTRDTRASSRRLARGTAADRGHAAAYPFAAGVFGIWSLPDRSTPAKRSLEDQLDAAFALYHKEVEQRHWYGFWNYGDVMHQHDGPRHMWRYDIGGFAWDNTRTGHGHVALV